MKKLFLALTMMAGTFGVFAQGDPAPAPAPDPNAPTMTFEKDAIDYGTIKQDAEGTRIFNFKNEGKVPIVISEAHGSCGCTVPTYPKEPIMPGQKAEISVHYDTHRVGAFSKSVTINSNAKNSPVVIRISGTVEAPAIVPTVADPTSIIPSPAPAPANVLSPSSNKINSNDVNKVAPATVKPATTSTATTSTTKAATTTKAAATKTKAPVKKTSTVVKKATTN